mmetsp:Transcript_10247/g.21387  ORF Transcript_10247/g.21387 Transcript_10247/m.21387 type:complete len:423 (-) Transcript_10247:510-1778(-)
MRREIPDPNDEIYCPQAALVSEEQARKTEERLRRYRERVYAQREAARQLELSIMRKNEMQRQLVLVGGFVVVSILVGWVWMRRGRVKKGERRARGKDGGGVPSEIFSSDDGGENFTLEELEQCFEEAARVAKQFPKSFLDQRDQLMLYGLYKQALEGDNRKIDPPSKMNVVATAKYNAWGKFRGVPKQFAMRKYCEVVHHFANGGESSFRNIINGERDENADVVYDEDDENCNLDEDGCPIGEGGAPNGRADENGIHDPIMMGMGIRQSMPLAKNLSNNKEMGSSPEILLRNAAISTNVTELKRAIDDGADVNDGDETGQTALHFAADKGSLDCVRFLVEAGANVNAKDEDGIGVLQTAISAALYGANVNGKDAKNTILEVIRFLLERGADPNACDDDGESPKRLVIEEGSEEVKALFASYA